MTNVEKIKKPEFSNVFESKSNFSLMENLKIMMNGPLFFQLLVYAVFIAMNLLQFNQVIWFIWLILLVSKSLRKFQQIQLKWIIVSLSILFTFNFFRSYLQMLSNFNFNILLDLNSFMTQILFNYISCYYADIISQKSFSASEIAYDMNWFEFPVKKQFIVKRMIERAQKPFYLKGYDIVDCSLKTFLNVRNWIWMTQKYFYWP